MRNISYILNSLTNIELEGVAKLGDEKYLDILVNNWSYTVRCEVAKHKIDKYLDILVHDTNANVLCEVAKHGRDKDLDILVHSKYISVLYEVARHGRTKDLDVLVHVKDFRILYEVAKHGRDKELDIIMNFKSDEIYDIENAMNEYHEDWALLYDNKASFDDVLFMVLSHSRNKDLDILIHSDCTNMLRAVAMYGDDVHLDELMKRCDLHTSVMCAIASRGRDKDLDILIHSDDINVIKSVWKYNKRPKDYEIVKSNPNIKFKEDGITIKGR